VRGNELVAVVDPNELLIQADLDVLVEQGGGHGIKGLSTST
jgi:hypothetical protein